MASKITEGFSLVSGAGSGIRKNTEFSVAESGATGTLFADINLQGAQEAATKSKNYASNPAVPRPRHPRRLNLRPANSLAVFPGKASYTTAKHAIVGITKTGAIDYTARGIRVNTVFPIWVSGPMNQYEASVNLHLDKIVQAVVPLKRIAQPDEVADAIVFLCSPAASFVTGASMLIDTGAGLTYHTSNAPSSNPKGIYKGVECKSAIQSHLKLSKSKLKFHIVLTSDDFLKPPSPPDREKKDGDCMEEIMKSEHRAIKSSNGGISKSQNK
ncbi:hypothetical protein DID88_008824 [Monilinia fructigena]|uniref:Uncharacterized protein n=1 Tax=Monilinia fructigena TaxID=38457 RepID=A0A395J704_9HELO|nr:hypothetical protein DID88_008824 [Monilinia fructigena]